MADVWKCPVCYVTDNERVVGRVQMVCEHDLCLACCIAITKTHPDVATCPLCREVFYEEPTADPPSRKRPRLSSGQHAHVDDGGIFVLDTPPLFAFLPGTVETSTTTVRPATRQRTLPRNRSYGYEQEFPVGVSETRQRAMSARLLVGIEVFRQLGLL